MIGCRFVYKYRYSSVDIMCHLDLKIKSLFIPLVYAKTAISIRQNWNMIILLQSENENEYTMHTLHREK